MTAREPSNPSVKPLPPGAPAPEMQLPDQLGSPMDLSDVDRPVLLAFHPLAWTETCEQHLDALESRADWFQQHDIAVFAVSVDPVPTLRAWAEALQLDFVRLLSDFWPHGAAAKAFGLFHEGAGVSERASVLIDSGGTIRLSTVHAAGEAPPFDAIVDGLTGD